MKLVIPENAQTLEEFRKLNTRKVEEVKQVVVQVDLTPTPLKVDDTIQVEGKKRGAGKKTKNKDDPRIAELNKFLCSNLKIDDGVVQRTNNNRRGGN